MSEHRCGGACCRRFLIGNNTSPAELKSTYLSWCAQHRDGTTIHLSKHLGEFRPKYCAERVSVDIHLVYPMLIHLGEFDWTPNNPDKKLHEKVHHWTCKHFDPEKAECTIYDIRPSMCVNYPGDRPCLFPGCEIPGNKERLEEMKQQSESKLMPEKCEEKWVKEEG